MTRGKIIRLLGGFYTVDSEIGLVETHAKGNFRHFGQKPLVGDWVHFTIEKKEGVQVLGYIESIEERTNTLLRPPVANVDQVILCVPVKDPAYNLQLVDSILVHYEMENLPIVILITKADLDPSKAQDLTKIYQLAGYTSKMVNLKSQGVKEALLPLLRGKTSVLAGVSGAGKSTLTSLCLGRKLQTGSVSEKTRRGKHTTRHVEIYPGDGFYLLDTPGFSRMDLDNCKPEDLADYFPEMKKQVGPCKFKDCSHISEPQCAVKKKLQEGLIAKSRYENYSSFYQELKEREKNKWH